MTDFETALDPCAAMYAGDIAMDQKAVEAVPVAIDLAVNHLKDLLRQNAFGSNAGMYHGLRRIGQLLDMRNRLTGECKNVGYLLFIDEKSSRYVAGFVKDAAGVFDSQGRQLLVGDVVYGCIQGQEVKRMVILNAKGESMLAQEWINLHDAVFLKDFSPVDMRETIKYPGCAICYCSCLKEYHAARDRQRTQEKKALVQQIKRGALR